MIIEYAIMASFSNWNSVTIGDEGEEVRNRINEFGGKQNEDESIVALRTNAPRWIHKVRSEN